MNEWAWSNGGMILTGENWSTGRKILYSIGGKWMNEHGATVEWYWQGKTTVQGGKFAPVPLCPTQVSLVNKGSNFILLTCRQRLSNLQDGGTVATLRTYFILLDN